MPTFTPPYVTAKAPEAPAPFNRLGMPRAVSVLKIGSSYRQVVWPSDDDVSAADIVYLGGRTYQISGAEASSLRSAGYSPVATITITDLGDHTYMVDGVVALGAAYGWDISGDDLLGNGDMTYALEAA